MGYGQLIWDVPKIEGIQKDDFPARRSRGVECFLDLDSVCGKGKCIKKRAHVVLGDTEFYAYGLFRTLFQQRG